METILNQTKTETIFIIGFETRKEMLQCHNGLFYNSKIKRNYYHGFTNKIKINLAKEVIGTDDNALDKIFSLCDSKYCIIFSKFNENLD